MILIFLDTSFFIAFFRDKDQDHQRSHQILEDIKNMHEHTITTAIVIAETLTCLKRLNGPKNVAKTSSDLIHSNILIGEITDIIKESVEIFNKYEQFSFCDASNIAFMRKNNIKKIISFDSDFDLVQGIERIS